VGWGSRKEDTEKKGEGKRGKTLKREKEGSERGDLEGEKINMAGKGGNMEGKIMQKEGRERGIWKEKKTMAVKGGYGRESNA
jgi:hypothetical protein